LTNQPTRKQKEHISHWMMHTCARLVTWATNAIRWCLL